MIKGSISPLRLDWIKPTCRERPKLVSTLLPWSMAGDGFIRVAVKLCQRVGHIAVGSAVISQAFNAVFLIPLIGDAIHFALQGDGGVEGGFKGPDKHGLGGQLLKLTDGLEIGSVVGGGNHQIVLHAF